jgi:exodeoxyribonuclease VII large subunit
MPGLFDDLPSDAGATPGPPARPAAARPLSVSELTSRLRNLIAAEFARVWVEGEISGVKTQPPGHVFFTLKDARAQMGGVIWQRVVRTLKFRIDQGLKVHIRGKIDLYPQRGTYSLIVDEIVPKGMGALELAFQQLKEELARLGWFAEERKRPLPRFPRRVAIVTSLSGAALQDMLRYLLPRWPLAEVWVVGVQVQGDGAAKAIADAIHLLNRVSPRVDVMIVGRGGGSLEDLWAFNERLVAAAIFHSKIPVVSAVGHETDFTIADFVADLRAATPTAAAMKVVPDQNELRRHLSQSLADLKDALAARCRTAAERLLRLADRPCLRAPAGWLRPRAQQLEQLQQRLHDAWRVHQREHANRLTGFADRLEALSPLKVLGRGYSLTHVAATQEIVRSATQAPPGTMLRTRLAVGDLWSLVVPPPEKEAHAAQ